MFDVVVELDEVLLRAAEKTVVGVETPGVVGAEAEGVSGLEDEDEKRLDRARRRRWGSGRDVGIAGLEELTVCRREEERQIEVEVKVVCVQVRK